MNFDNSENPTDAQSRHNLASEANALVDLHAKTNELLADTKEDVAETEQLLQDVRQMASLYLRHVPPGHAPKKHEEAKQALAIIDAYLERRDREDVHVVPDRFIPDGPVYLGSGSE